MDSKSEPVLPPKKASFVSKTGSGMNAGTVKADEVKSALRRQRRIHAMAETKALKSAIAAARLDPDAACEALFRAADTQAPTELPRVRVWLLNELHDIHFLLRQYDEAAETCMHVVDAIERAGKVWLPVRETADTTRHQRAQEQARGLLGPEHSLAGGWSTWDVYRDALKDQLTSAATYFFSTEAYTRALEVHQRKLALWHEDGDAVQEAKQVRDMQEVSKVLASAAGRTADDADGAGLRSHYYRVVLYAWQAAKDAHMRANYMFKEPPFVRREDLAARLCSAFGALEVTPRISDARCGLKRGVTYVSVTKALPHATIHSTAPLDRYEGVRFFGTNEPVAMGGRKQVSNMEKQFVRHVRVEVAATFPTCLARQRVVRTADVIMTPIEKAIAEVQQRSAELRWQLNRDGRTTRRVDEATGRTTFHDTSDRGVTVDLKTLSQRLHGTVLNQVNGGMSEVAELFLRHDTRKLLARDALTEDDEARVMGDSRAERLRGRLRDRLVDCLQCCVDAIRLYKELAAHEGRRSSGVDDKGLRPREKSPRRGSNQSADGAHGVGVGVVQAYEQGFGVLMGQLYPLLMQSNNPATRMQAEKLMDLVDREGWNDGDSAAVGPLGAPLSPHVSIGRRKEV
eukprot:g1074.t1